MEEKAWSVFLDGNNNTYSYSCVKDNINNVYAVGYSDSNIITIGEKSYSRNSENSAGYIVKLDNLGNVLWFYWIDGDTLQSVYSIAIDKNNNVYLTGYSNSDKIILKEVSYSKSNTTSAGFVIKFNQTGDLLWFNWIDGALSDTGYSIAVDSNNYIYITGVSNSNSLNDVIKISNDNAGFLIKMNELGEVIWFKWIEGPNNDDSYSLVIDSLDNIYVSGNSESNNIKINNNTYFRNNNNQSIYLAKFTPEGVDAWCFWISGDNIDTVSSIICDTFNYIYLCGISNSTSITINDKAYSKINKDNINSSFVLKINSNITHNVEWFKWIEGDNEGFSYTIATDNSNNLYLTGTTNSDYIMIDEIQYENSSLNENAYLLKLNNNGNLDWIKWLFNYDKFEENKDYTPKAYIANILIDKNYYIYINGYTNAKQLYLNNDIIVSKNNENENTFIIKYDLNEIAKLENIKIYLLITNNNFAYKYFFYMLVRIILFIMLIYIIWLIYKSTSK
jgi:hypothetical protein